MGFFRRFEKRTARTAGNESGVALFMVLASVAILSLLVTEFIYVAKLNQKLAYDAADQLKAHYLAKSALKISLLRLKAYQNVKSFISNAGGGAGGGAVSSMVPKGMIEKIWNFPFMYPIPTELPGLSPAQKADIEKFEKESSLSGTFTALIQSESSKFNINMALAPFAGEKKPPEDPNKKNPPGGAQPPEGQDPENPEGQNPEGQNPEGAAEPAFDPAKAREAFGLYIRQIFQNKFLTDRDFEDLYGNFDIDLLIESIISWTDRTFQSNLPIRDDEIKLKQAPFYSVSELHMVPYMDDTLYDLLAPNFTVSTTPGVNVNTMQKEMLRALIPEILEEEIKEFYEYRDSLLEDNLFKQPDDFFTYIQNNISFFGGNSGRVQDFKKTLTDRGIRIVTDETEFKIEVRAQVNSSTRMIEAWVTLKAPIQGAQPGQGGQPAQGGFSRPRGGGGLRRAAGPVWLGAATKRPESGLKITFMRVY